MKYKDFIKVLKTKDLKPVYLFYGEEEYLIDYTLKLIKKSFVNEGLESLNHMVLNGEDLEFKTIMNACETLPFMAEKKIVIIKDLPLFQGKAAKDPLVDYIEKVRNHVLLIFVVKSKNIKKNNALYKRINKFGHVVEFDKLRGRDLDNWIIKAFKKYGKGIDRPTINYFIEYSSYFDTNRKKTLYNLENEIIKISNYLTHKNIVDKKDIEDLMTKPLEMNVFNLLNAIARKDGNAALRLFNEMYLSSEPILFILHMIVRQIRNMLRYKILMDQGYVQGERLKKMGISPYEYKKISQQSTNFTIEQLKRALGFCIEADRTIKSSSTEDKLIMEILISSLCFKL